jgi:hypothetical protein
MTDAEKVWKHILDYVKFLILIVLAIVLEMSGDAYNTNRLHRGGGEYAATATNNNSSSSGGGTSRSSRIEIELMLAIANRLNTGLNEEALEAIVDLLHAGVHPDAIVAVVTSLQQQDFSR